MHHYLLRPTRCHSTSSRSRRRRLLSAVARAAHVVSHVQSLVAVLTASCATSLLQGCAIAALLSRCLLCTLLLRSASLPSRHLLSIYRAPECKHTSKYKRSRIETVHSSTHIYAFIAFIAALGAAAAFIAFFAMLRSVGDWKRVPGCKCHSRQASLNQTQPGMQQYSACVSMSTPIGNLNLLWRQSFNKT